MRIVGIFMFIFLGVISIIGLAALDNTWFSFILGVCAFMGGAVSGLLTFMDHGNLYRDAHSKIVEENKKYEKVIRLLNEEIIRLKSEVLNKIK